MKLLLVIMLIFLLNDFANIQASEDLRAIHNIGHIKPRPKRGFSGNNINLNFLGKGFGNLASCRTCGLSLARKKWGEGMIVRGNNVKPPFKYPWMVALQTDGKTTCGGSLLTANYILTAAHCLIKSTENPSEDIEYLRPNEITVAFVTGNAKEVEPGPPLMAAIPHPEFSYANLKYDVALLRLRHPITCNKFRNPICLPSAAEDVNVGEVLTIVGWGSEGGGDRDVSKVLKEGIVRTVSFNRCEGLFTREMGSHVFCLEGENNQGPCEGDSGGPLFDKRGERYFVFGVTSMHSSETCNPTDPFVYTSVSKHMGWIQQVMGPDFPMQPFDGEVFVGLDRYGIEESQDSSGTNELLSADGSTDGEDFVGWDPYGHRSAVKESQDSSGTNVLLSADRSTDGEGFLGLDRYGYIAPIKGSQDSSRENVRLHGDRSTGLDRYGYRAEIKGSQGSCRGNVRMSGDRSTGDCRTRGKCGCSSRGRQNLPWISAHMRSKGDRRSRGKCGCRSRGK